MGQLGMCYQLKQSVGFNGKNDPADVEVVQTLLIENDVLPRQDVCYTPAALIDAINASVLTIGAAEGAGDSATLTHQTLGVIGNAAITKTGANIAVTGMTGGV